MVDAEERNLEVWNALSEYKRNQKLLRLGEHDYIRSLRETDVSLSYVSGLNDPDVNQFLVGPKKQYQTIAIVRDYVHSNWIAKDSILFGLFVGDVLRGTARLHDATSSSAHMGIALFDKSIWGSGWGSRMIEVIVRHAITSLNISYVRAGIDSANIASQHAFTKAGFHHLSSKDKYHGDDLIQTWDFHEVIK